MVCSEEKPVNIVLGIYGQSKFGNSVQTATLSTSRERWVLAN
jgi:hypothetical protein